MKYLLLVLGVLLAIAGTFGVVQHQRLASAQSELAVHEATAAQNTLYFKQIDAMIQKNDELSEQLQSTRKEFVKVRQDITRTIKEAMQNEVFSVWYNSPAPTDAQRVLCSAAAKSGVEVRDGSCVSGSDE